MICLHTLKVRRLMDEKPKSIFVALATTYIHDYANKLVCAPLTCTCMAQIQKESG